MAERRIFKYPIEIAHQTLKVHGSPNVVRVGLDPIGVPCVWAEVDPSRVDELPLQVYGTGGTLQSNVGAHLGSFVSGSRVWHVYQVRA